MRRTIWLNPQSGIPKTGIVFPTDDFFFRSKAPLLMRAGIHRAMNKAK